MSRYRKCVCTGDGILFSLEREGNSAIFDNMDGSEGKSLCLSEISQAQKTNTTWYYLHDKSKIVKLIETQGLGEGISREVTVKEYKTSVIKMNK